MSLCQRCGSTIKWIRMETTAKPVPVEPIPGDTGTVAARYKGTQLYGYVISAIRPLRKGYQLYTAHHGECARRTDHPPARPSLEPADTDPMF